MKSHIKNYLSITKKEWNGMVILLIIIAIVLAAPYVFQLFRKDSAINLKDFDKDVVLLNSAKGSGTSAYPASGEPCRMKR